MGLLRRLSKKRRRSKPPPHTQKKPSFKDTTHGDDDPNCLFHGEAIQLFEKELEWNTKNLHHHGTLASIAHGLYANIGFRAGNHGSVTIDKNTFMQFLEIGNVQRTPLMSILFDAVSMLNLQVQSNLDLSYYEPVFDTIHFCLLYLRRGRRRTLLYRLN